MITREELIKIGQFNKPHGIHGEISFSFTDDVFDRTDCPFIVCEIDGIFVPFYIEEYRFKGETTALFKLEDIDNDNDARAFTNLDVYFPKSYLKIEEEDYLAPGDFFIGYTVVDIHHGILGKIVHIDDSTINILFIVDRGTSELLIPANDDFVISVDEKNKIIKMNIPDGLLNL
ncbi:ribosome maturation factor RimM [uncultured Coprobacter sp.]|jgi:16S rRNA processing protein rimM|uniref:ribosome maturation factor RimM n=1 Tax=uncultured Coprobacter sp. TaxID=1720550 RepID=UPI0025E17734|nr:ribosome maturation factor RimM [uncultured Coprobacter sp.]